MPQSPTTVIDEVNGPDSLSKPIGLGRSRRFDEGDKMPIAVIEYPSMDSPRRHIPTTTMFDPAYRSYESASTGATSTSLVRVQADDEMVEIISLWEPSHYESDAGNESVAADETPDSHHLHLLMDEEDSTSSKPTVQSFEDVVCRTILQSVADGSLHSSSHSCDIGTATKYCSAEAILNDLGHVVEEDVYEEKDETYDDQAADKVLEEESNRLLGQLRISVTRTLGDPLVKVVSDVDKSVTQVFADEESDILVTRSSSHTASSFAPQPEKQATIDSNQPVSEIIVKGTVPQLEPLVISRSRLSNHDREYFTRDPFEDDSLLAESLLSDANTASETCASNDTQEEASLLLPPPPPPPPPRLPKKVSTCFKTDFSSWAAFDESAFVDGAKSTSTTTTDEMDSTIETNEMDATGGAELQHSEQYSKKRTKPQQTPFGDSVLLVGGEHPISRTIMIPTVNRFKSLMD